MVQKQVIRMVTNNAPFWQVGEFGEIQKVIKGGIRVNLGGESYLVSLTDFELV